MVRHKNRYIVVEVNQIKYFDAPILKLKESSLYFAITTAVQQLYGDFGVASIQAGFVAKYLNEQTRVAIVRVRRGPHKFVSSAIPLIKNLDGKPVVINIVYVGASIKQCFSFLKNYQQKKFDEYCINLNSVEDRNQLKKVMLNFENLLGKFV